MPTSKSRIYAALIVCMICACDNVSTEGSHQLSGIKARIRVQQYKESASDNTISIDLYDTKDREIVSDSVILYVNNQAVTRQSQGGFYTRRSAYQASKVPVDNQFFIEIALQGQARVFLAKVDALPSLLAKNIQTNTKRERGDYKKDLTLTWKDLIGVNELVLDRSVTLLNQSNQINVMPPLTMPIKEAGSYTIPTTQFVDKTSVLSTVGFQFRSERKGVVHPMLLKGSEITIGTELSTAVFFDERTYIKNYANN